MTNLNELIEVISNILNVGDIEIEGIKLSNSNGKKQTISVSDLISYLRNDEDFNEQVEGRFPAKKVKFKEKMNENNAGEVLQDLLSHNTEEIEELQKALQKNLEKKDKEAARRNLKK